MTQPNNPPGFGNGETGSPVIPTVLPVLSEAARDALNGMPWDIIGPEVGEAIRRERGANQTLVDYVAEAMGPQLRVLKEENPLMTDEELGLKVAKGASALTLYLLARQASIDSADLDTGIVDPIEES